MIRDTSAQDTLIKPAPVWRRRWPLAAAALLLALGLVWGWPQLSRALSAGGSSVSLARLNVAAVERGELVRDVAGEGKVVAAASPTLYAGNAGIVSLLVQAGDAVKRNQVLVRITSAELTAKL